MTPLSLQFYRLGTGLLSPLAPMLLRSRAKRGKEDAARLPERLGHAGRPRPDGDLVWLHGASVGESLSLLPLIESLRAMRPDLSILVTSGTITSAEMMHQRLPAGVIHQYAPVDTPGSATRFLAYWRPKLSVFVESEIWPNLIFGAKAECSSLALISARLSDASLKGWSRFPTAAKTVFGAFSLVMAQTDATAGALANLGARDDGRLNLKRLGAPPPVDKQKLAILREATAGYPVFLAASTHPGEDEIVLDAFRSSGGETILVITPRHPNRGGEIEQLALQAGFTTGLRSRGDRLGAGAVYIADTLGELGLWFCLARIAFIGGSLLTGPGGHNPVEAAQLGCPIIVGPHLDNWTDIYADLFKADAAITVLDAETLAAAFEATLQNPIAAKARAEHARQVLEKDDSALHGAVDRLIGLLL